MQPASVDELQQRIGIQFKDPALLAEALRHTSYLMEHTNQELRSNERLEFLGDAILGYLAADYLYHAFPDASEGYLTELRASMIRGTALARFAEELGLDRYLAIGRGLHGEMGIGKAKPPPDPRPRQKVLGRAMEAVIGAILLDQGLAVVRSFVLPYLERASANALATTERAEAVTPASEEQADPRQEPSVALMVQNGNYKTALQEIAQGRLRITPRYVFVRSSGPPHALEFEVEARLADKVIAVGKGMSKQRATQVAAQTALENWPQIEAEFIRSIPKEE